MAGSVKKKNGGTANHLAHSVGVIAPVARHDHASVSSIRPLLQKEQSPTALRLAVTAEDRRSWANGAACGRVG